MVKETIITLQNRRKVLKEEIRLKRTLHYEEMYKLLSELFDIEKKLNKKYTLRQLAEDNDLHEQWVYKIMSWRKASIYVQEQVKIGRMGMARACRVLSKIPEQRQDEVIEYITEKKLSDKEIDLHVKKYETEKAEIIANRIYNNKSNIYRDLTHYCSKINRCLNSVNHIPKNKKKEAIKHLKKLKEKITISIKKLK